MLAISIPGFGDLHLKHLVLDYNGTLACDGRMIQAVNRLLEALAEHLKIHVITADTFGQAKSAIGDLPCELVILPEDNQDAGKLAYIERLGPDSVVSIGNGRNDRLMLSKAALAVAVVQQEGAASPALLAADIVCSNIHDALQLLSNPLRLTATLRS